MRRERWARSRRFCIDQNADALEIAQLWNAFFIRNHGFNARFSKPIGHIARGQEQRCGNRHRPHSDQAEHGNPPLRDTWQHDQNARAAFESRAAQKVSRLATQSGHLSERVLPVSRSGRIHMPKRQRVRADPCPSVHHISGKVKVTRGCQCSCEEMLGLKHRAGAVCERTLQKLITTMIESTDWVAGRS